jgi:hypothetical protein
MTEAGENTVLMEENSVTTGVKRIVAQPKVVHSEE